MSLASWLRRSTSTPEQLVMVDAIPRDLYRAMEDRHVAPFHQTLPQLAYEVARARRYERPLTIALFAADASAAVPPQLNGHAGLEPTEVTKDLPIDGAQSWASSALMTVLLATLLRESLREADIVTYAPRFAICVVGMPETHAEGARTAVARVQALCLARLLTPVRAGVAEFSKSGWTLEELIRQAESDATSASSLTASVEFIPERQP